MDRTDAMNSIGHETHVSATVEQARSTETTAEQRQELGYGLRDVMLAACCFPTRESFPTLPACLLALPELLRYAVAAEALLAPCALYAHNFAHHYALNSTGIAPDFDHYELSKFWSHGSPYTNAQRAALTASKSLPTSRERYRLDAEIGGSDAHLSRVLLEGKEHLTIHVRPDYVERVVSGPGAVCMGLVTLDANLLATFDESTVRVYAARWVRTKRGIATETFGWIVCDKETSVHIEATYLTSHGYGSDLLPRVLPSPKELAKAFRKVDA